MSVGRDQTFIHLEMLKRSCRIMYITIPDADLLKDVCGENWPPVDLGSASVGSHRGQGPPSEEEGEH